MEPFVHPTRKRSGAGATVQSDLFVALVQVVGPL
jgi:hypothetical protein